MRVFIFGAGYSAQAFARSNDGRAEAIIGTTRSNAKFPALEKAGITPLLFDGVMSSAIASALAETTHLVVSAAPDERGDPVLLAARDAILGAMPGLEWIGYLSTIGVYGDHGGAWIDETASCRPTSRRSNRRVEAERDWIALGQERNVPVAVLRLSGIYGPGRNAFVNLRNGTAKRLVKKDQVFNRIHVADIAGALWHLAGHRTGGILNVTDDLPAPPQDVVAFAAELMGVAPPPEVPFETAELTPMARSFYGENKRVSNQLIRGTGFRFRYPDYASAFTAMWRDRTWDRGMDSGRSTMAAD